jgi:ferredoxin-NADP reductase
LQTGKKKKPQALKALSYNTTMLSFIDNQLNKITMYRLVFYYLLILLAIAATFGFTGIIQYGGFAIIVSVIMLTAVCYGANLIFAKSFGAPVNNDSVYITAFILALIINPATNLNGFLFLLWAGILAMATKYILAYKKKHFFNPAAAAVFITSLFLNLSASWWISTAAMMVFVIVGGLFLIRKIQRFDMVIGFLAAFFVTCVSYNLVKGFGVWDTVYIAATHTPAFFFAFVMLTEPATSPSTRIKRIAYGVFIGFLSSPQVSILGYYFTPESALLAGNIFSFIISPTKKLALKLKEKVEVAQNTYDFVFGLDKPMAFAAGQYMEWTLGHADHDSRGIRRYFTVASAPSEPELRIGVRFSDPGSSYKKTLLGLKEGDIVIAAGLAGDFTLPKDTSKKLVFIAGGIGVTPFRSMVRELLAKKEKRDVVILYSNREEQHTAYKDIFAQAEKELGIKTIYVMTEKDGVINAELIKHAVPDYKGRIFYVSGPERLVQGMKQALKSISIRRQNIRTDYFPGF